MSVDSIDYTVYYLEKVHMLFFGGIFDFSVISVFGKFAKSSPPYRRPNRNRQKKTYHKTAQNNLNIDKKNVKKKPRKKSERKTSLLPYHSATEVLLPDEILREAGIASILSLKGKS